MVDILVLGDVHGTNSLNGFQRVLVRIHSIILTLCSNRSSNCTDYNDNCDNGLIVNRHSGLILTGEGLTVRALI